MQIVAYDLGTGLKQNEEADAETKKPKPWTRFIQSSHSLTMTLTTDKSLLLPHNRIN